MATIGLPCCKKSQSPRIWGSGLEATRARRRPTMPWLESHEAVGAREFVVVGCSGKILIRGRDLWLANLAEIFRSPHPFNEHLSARGRMARASTIQLIAITYSATVSLIPRVPIHFSNRELAVDSSRNLRRYRPNANATTALLYSRVQTRWPSGLIATLRTWAEHLAHVRTVFCLLRHHQLLVKKSKCSFGVDKVCYLGHIINATRVSMDSNKVQTVLDWPQPQSVKGLRGFLGLAGFYRKFIQDFGVIAAPLTSLLRKHNFVWTEAATVAFQALKIALTSAPVLQLPDFSKQFVV
nr:AC090485_10 Putative retroelement [Ipomoea batatas]